MICLTPTFMQRMIIKRNSSVFLHLYTVCFIEWRVSWMVPKIWIFIAVHSMSSIHASPTVHMFTLMLIMLHKKKPHYVIVRMPKAMDRCPDHVGYHDKSWCGDLHGGDELFLEPTFRWRCSPEGKGTLLVAVWRKRVEARKVFLYISE